MKGSVITPQLAQVAVNLALPLISTALQRPECGDGGNLHIVLVYPLASAATCTFDEAILHEHSIGDPETWDADYRGFAHAKARLSWRTGLDTHVVQELRPQLLRSGDTLLWGSVVVDGVVVGVSGAHPWYDEMFAGTVALCLRALAKEKVASARGKSLYLE